MMVDEMELASVVRPPAPESRILCRIGDISVADRWVGSPRMGWQPLAGSRWSVSDRTQIVSYRPAVCIAFAVLTFWTVFGLLLLLIKNERTAGFVEVAVEGPTFYDSTRLEPTPTAMMEASDGVRYIQNVERRRLIEDSRRDLDILAENDRT